MPLVAGCDCEASLDDVFTEQAARNIEQQKTTTNKRDIISSQNQHNRGFLSFHQVGTKSGPAW